MAGRMLLLFRLVTIVGSCNSASPPDAPAAPRTGDPGGCLAFVGGHGRESSINWKAVAPGQPTASAPQLDLLAPSSAWPHAIGGAAGNGRTAGSLDSPRTTRWVCELAEGPPVERLLVLGDRVLAVRAPDESFRQQVELIELSAGKGRHVRTFEGRAGDWAIDAQHSMLLGSAAAADFTAWSLDDPKRPPIVVFGRVSGRELDGLRVVGDTLVIVTRELDDPHGPPPDVLVDVLRIPHYDDVSQFRSLRGQTLIAERIADGPDGGLLGLDSAGPVLVSEAGLWWGDWHLRERGRLGLGPGVVALQYTPRSDGSAWLLTQREDHIELSQVVAGRCNHAFALEPSLVDPGPLRIGPDDGVVVIGSNRAASYAADGALVWSVARSSPATGLIDSRGVTLYPGRGGLVATDRKGTQMTIWTAPGDVGELGPLAATDAGVWVGAGLRVFALQ